MLTENSVTCQAYSRNTGLTSRGLKWMPVRIELQILRGNCPRRNLHNLLLRNG